MQITNLKAALIVLLSIAMLAAGVIANPSLAGEESRETTRAGGVTLAEFERLHQKLAQMSTEKVWSIPWKLSVREAREVAAREKKPVFLWISSNGGTHPLGPC